MGAGASVDGAAPSRAQLTRGQSRYFCHICRLAFNTSETSASVPCPRCGDTFVERVEEVSHPGAGRTAFRVIHGGGRSDLELSEEQRRRLFNAAALLQLLETHLREELMALERAVRESESNKTPHALTGLEKHTYLRGATIDKEAMCAQPSCPICGEDFSVDETALQIQCSHLFHEQCVVPWLELKHNCPICRLDMSETLPLPGELEELTVAEIKQRIQWHGDQPDTTDDKAQLANDLYKILLHHRETYNDQKEPADVEERDPPVEGAHQLMRPGQTYTISSHGMIRQASGPISSLLPVEGQNDGAGLVVTAASAPTPAAAADVATTQESVV